MTSPRANNQPGTIYTSGQVTEDLSLLTFVAEISDGNIPITLPLDDIVFVTYNFTAGVGLIDA